MFIVIFVTEMNSFSKQKFHHHLQIKVTNLGALRKYRLLTIFNEEQHFHRFGYAFSIEIPTRL